MVSEDMYEEEEDDVDMDGTTLNDAYSCWPTLMWSCCSQGRGSCQDSDHDQEGGGLHGDES